MKHFWGAAAIAVGAFVVSCFGMTQTAQAGTIKISDDYFSTSYGGVNGGGEFGVVLFTGGPNIPLMGSGVQVGTSLFETFCLERNETLNDADTFDFTIATGAVRGGYAGQDSTIDGLSADSLDAKTAYLYSKFWAGNLTSYDYTVGAGRVASAAALQLAIWKIEQELTGGTDLNSAFNGNTLANTFYNDAVANAGTGIGAVRVLNLTLTKSDGTVQRQSLLILIPLPSAAWLGLGMLSAMGAVGIIRRRRRQALA